MLNFENCDKMLFDGAGPYQNTHHGYNHNENDGPKGASNPTAEEMKMVERIKKIWYTKRGKP